MRAILSAANREGLVELAQRLQARGVTLFSTSGTGYALQEAGIAVEPVSKVTQFPENSQRACQDPAPGYLWRHSGAAAPA